MVADRPVFRETGWETSRKGFDLDTVSDVPETPQEGSQQATESNEMRARRRAKSKVRDLARANRFDWFVTLTLDAAKIDRYDYFQIVKRLNRWLDNRVRRNGLRYVMVAERHKDGAVHYHALMSWDSLQTVDSGHKDKRGRIVYNLPAWDYGFTTAVRLDGDYRRVCGYISKYITKSTGEGKVGGRWYYRGGQLAEPSIEFSDVDLGLVRWEDVPGHVVRPDGCKAQIKVFEVSQNGEVLL